MIRNGCTLVAKDKFRSICTLVTCLFCNILNPFVQTKYHSSQFWNSACAFPFMVLLANNGFFKFQEVTIVMFFRQHWLDPRLAYGSSLGIPKMRLLGNIVDQVWLPNTFFVNDLSDAKPSKDFLFELTEEGHITYSHRCLEIFLT